VQKPGGKKRLKKYKERPDSGRSLLHQGVSLSGSFGEVAAALAMEMVTADVSCGGNAGAWKSARGGGWVLNNARYRKPL